LVGQNAIQKAHRCRKKDWQKFSSDAPFRHAGLDARLTGVEHANVVKKLLA